MSRQSGSISHSTLPSCMALCLRNVQSSSPAFACTSEELLFNNCQRYCIIGCNSYVPQVSWPVNHCLYRFFGSYLCLHVLIRTCLLFRGLLRLVDFFTHSADFSLCVMRQNSLHSSEFRLIQFWHSAFFWQKSVYSLVLKHMKLSDVFPSTS